MLIFEKIFLAASLIFTGRACVTAVPVISTNTKGRFFQATRKTEVFYAQRMAGNTETE
jgi:hypothetical protein